MNRTFVNQKLVCGLSDLSHGNTLFTLKSRTSRDKRIIHNKNEQVNNPDPYCDHIFIDTNTEEVPDIEWENNNDTSFNKIDIWDDIQHSPFKGKANEYIEINAYLPK